MIKKLLYIIGAIAFIFISVIVLETFKRKGKENGFQRNFNNQTLNVLKTFQLPRSSMLYFAGSSKTGMYFKDLFNLDTLIFIDYQLVQSKKIPLVLPGGIQNKNNRQINIGITDSSIFVIDNKIGQLTTIANNTGQRKSYKSPSIRLDNTFLLSNNSVLSRNTIVNGEKFGRQLVKVNITEAKIEKDFLLKKQIDGFFCTDGKLTFDISNTRLYYVYTYRGEFLCLDTNLNMLYKAKTIDTVTTAVIKLVNTSKQLKSKTITQSAPPKIVNRNLTIYKNDILVLSGLKSDNEDYTDFKNNQVVDVYNINNGKYKYSFYIPKYKNIKLRSIYLNNGFIFAVFDSYLVKFKPQTPIGV